MMRSSTEKIVNAWKFCILSLSLLTINNIHAQDMIIWGRSNTHPFFFSEGPYKNQGRYDQSILFLQEHLPAYKHEMVQAPLPRIFFEIKNGHPWCFINATKTQERQAWAYFSIPANLYLRHEIIIRKDQQAKFENFGELSLTALLADSSLLTNIFRGVSYGETVDAILRQHPNLEFYSDTKEAIKMLLAGRIDYLIWDRMSAFYTAKELMQEGKLTALPFKEVVGFEATYVMCPKNEWGQRVIQEINKVLLAQRPSPRYRRISETWLDEDGVRKIRKIYDAFFLKAE